MAHGIHARGSPWPEAAAEWLLPWRQGRDRKAHSHAVHTSESRVHTSESTSRVHLPSPHPEAANEMEGSPHPLASPRRPPRLRVSGKEGAPPHLPRCFAYAMADALTSRPGCGGSHRPSFLVSEREGSPCAHVPLHDPLYVSVHALSTSA